MEQEQNVIPEEQIPEEQIPEVTVPEDGALGGSGETAGNATEQNEPEKEEVPVIDFFSLDSDGIISKARELTASYEPGAIRETMEKLPGIFEKKYRDEYEAALATFTEAGNPAEDFKYQHDNKNEFYAVYRQYREKKAAANHLIELEREENLKAKLAVIEDLKELVKKEESIDRTFQEFRDIQERWRNIGMVPQAQLNGLLETYHLHVENFYNYIKINKELRDLDLKRNLDAKLSICTEAEALAGSNDIAAAFKQLQLLHARWKEIGPIPKEQKEEVWERFKAATTQINGKYHSFFESLRQEQENNLKIKEDICTRAAALVEAGFTTIADWNNATKQILELQEEWKQSGTVPQKERNRIFKQFRTSCDRFFDLKRNFYRKMGDEQEKNLQLKIALCEKVEAVQDSTEWKTTTDRIISYQKEWKKLGAAPKKYSNKVWARFRAACDKFFNRKAEFFKDIDAEQEKNLQLKKALIEEVKQFQLSGNNSEDISRLKEFQSRWSAIGFVPLKAKEAVQDEFRNAINTWFDKLNLDEFDRDLERYRTRISGIENGGNKEFRIINEREKLVAKIRQLETDINTWENNIGFIAKSSKSQALIRDLGSKIEKTKQKLHLLQEKLKALDTLI